MAYRRIGHGVDDARDARRSLKEAHEKLDAEMGRRALITRIIALIFSSISA